LDGSVASGKDGTAVGLDGAPSTSFISVDVLGARRVVLDHERAHLHAVRALGVVGRALGPLDGALAVSRITAAPCAKLDLHRCLRVLALGVGGLERTDRLAFDLPNNLLGGPLDGVLFEACLTAGVGVKGAAVVCGGLAFSKVVGLDLVGIGTQPLPVNLVERVRLQYKAADNASSGRGLHDNLDLAEHNVPFGRELGCVTRLGHGEGDAVGTVRRIALGRKAV